jgi:hypothetical protein
MTTYTYWGSSLWVLVLACVKPWGPSSTKSTTPCFPLVTVFQELVLGHFFEITSPRYNYQTYGHLWFKDLGTAFVVDQLGLDKGSLNPAS